MTDIVKIQSEIKGHLANREVMQALLNTTFKGLKPTSVSGALTEGMMRGYSFKDFLEKNVYAIPFSDGYSLVTSIDHARKVGMRSGVCGKSAPVYHETADGKIISCTITIKRKVAETIGEYSATVYFDEYNTKRNQWASKPRTMIAKVAEMHALRMACPEELSQSYAEEEMESEIKPVQVQATDLEPYKAKLSSVKDLAELKTVWATLPIEAKQALEGVKTELKKKYSENA